ncbi:MAG TPA: hypothetical protein VGJ29_16900 [Vicinamibacterales bacterium]
MRIAAPLWLTVSLMLGIGSATPVVHLGKAETWLQLDAEQLQGRPAQLAWSDTEDSLYLQTVEGTTAGALKVRHYLLEKDRGPALLDSQPAWAREYWKWKSAKSYFGDRMMTIEVDSRRETVDPIRDRNTAYLNSDTYAPGTLEAKATGGSHIVNRLLLKGHVIGEFIDEDVFPGYTFSWSPNLLGLIAFRERNGRLAIMDLNGATQTANEGKDVLLPAWSPSGELIAYLERDGRKRFRLSVVSTI